MKNNQVWLDLLPLLAFLLVYFLTGKNMMLAIPVIMVTTSIAVGISYWQSQRIRVMPLVTLAMILVFGGLALYFNNPVFFMIKPTIIYLLFAAGLLSGLWFGQHFLKLLFEAAFDLPEPVWTTLTWRWAGFFLFLAGVNEFVWRTFGESVWAVVKVAGFLPATFLFAFSQMPLMMKYIRNSKSEPSE
ncbi:hypothetical protein MNBD_ALPHA06-1917 [hydrothermal vent metagenome]|uniref:Intracellular septation protein IspA n=1 Tax=hydrothermal vent metagenome TaxID=652676 RepID=A0A3B0RPX9_9ZZZZ